MPRLSASRLASYRARTFHLTSRLRSARQALSFVEARGFIFFWPIRGCDLPSLWVATAGDRPVPSQHDDPAHVTWRWKDEMLGRKLWHYAKLLRGRATLVSLKTLPYFYALSERVADLDDYRLAYEAGGLSRAAVDVAEALRRHGALDTVRLRRSAHLSSEAAKTRFDHALVELQRGLWVVPIGVAEAGAWRYAFVYELLDRWHPKVAAQARSIVRPAARAHLAGLYLRSVGATTRPTLARLFGWRTAEAQAALEAATEAGHALALGDGRWATPGLWPGSAGAAPHTRKEAKRRRRGQKHGPRR